MSSHHIVGKLEHRGAIAFYNETGPVTDSGTHITFEYRDIIHNRDYYSYEINKSQPTVYLTHVGAFDTTLYNRTPSNLLPLGSYEGGANEDYQCNITINSTGTPTKRTGFIDDAGSYSPLRERFNRHGKSLSDDGELACTKNNSLQFGSNDTVQSSTNTGWNPVTGFPFTLEAWAKPIDGGPGDSAGGIPRLVLGINHPGSDTSTNTPGTSWRHWGIGFRGSNNVGFEYHNTPMIMWGGWDHLIAHTPVQGTQVCGVDDENRQTALPMDDTVDAYEDEWHHIVGVFYGEESFALYHNGRCIQYSGDIPPELVDDDTEKKTLRCIGSSPVGALDYRPWNHSGDGDRSITPISGNLCVSLGGNRHQNGITDAWYYKRDFHGNIAHSSIYDRALSTREVYDHYITMTQGATLMAEGNSSTSPESRRGGVTRSSKINTWGNPYGKQLHVIAPVTLEGTGDPPANAWWSLGKRSLKYRSNEYCMAMQGGLYRKKQSLAFAELFTLENTPANDYMHRDNVHSSGTTILMYITPCVNTEDMSQKYDDYDPVYNPATDQWQAPLWNNYGLDYEHFTDTNAGWAGLNLYLTKEGGQDNAVINAKWGTHLGSLGGSTIHHRSFLTGFGALEKDKIEPASPFKMNPLMGTSPNIIPRLNSIGFLLNADETSIWLNKINVLSIGATSTGSGIDLQPTEEGTLRHIWYNMRAHGEVSTAAGDTGDQDMNVSYFASNVNESHLTGNVNWFPATRMGPYALIGDGTIEHTPNVSGHHQAVSGSTMVDIPTLDRLIRGRPPMRRRFGMNVCRRHYELSRMPLKGQRR